jgi:sodium transport system permease protein
LLAVVLHPAANVLQLLVQHLYRVSDNVLPAFEKMQAVFRDADFWPLLMIIALLPAICEELAFRGFILSGFRHLGNKWRAIVLSAILFGVTHGILQQSLIACLLGAVLGFLAVQSGSILPGMVFHVLHNGLAVANSRITPGMVPKSPLLHSLVTPVGSGGCLFEWPVVVVGSLAAVLLLLWFGRLKSPKSQEELLNEAIERGRHEAMPRLPEEAACGGVAD